MFSTGICCEKLLKAILKLTKNFKQVINFPQVLAPLLLLFSLKMQFKVTDTVLRTQYELVTILTIATCEGIALRQMKLVFISFYLVTPTSLFS